ncbi:MAG TPA: Rv3654c family TadE-like protein [Jiangellales bacterium]|nr:Rv3654c family TadE-like protein [Jiangellales bacterium]
MTGRSRAVGARDMGSGSLLVVMVTMVLLAAAAAAGTLAQAVGARHQAALAADLGALAAARHLPQACSVADRVVEANGARLVGCTVSGTEVVVAAQVRLSGPAVALGLPDPVRLARAGPALGHGG